MGLDDAPAPGGERRDARHRRPRADRQGGGAQRHAASRCVCSTRSASACPPPRSDELGLGYRDLDDLLREADIVTVHVPLTDGTELLLDARRLGLLRDGACLVNTARGALVDEQALVAELAAGRIRAGLDVFTDEPNVPPELLELPNVVLTPHLGSATQETREAMTRVLVDNLQAAEAGRPLPNPVYAS